MVDKKMIIDGIDVSKCEYCLKMTRYRCTIQRDVHKCLCEENPNCHYKRLKRKEQALDEIEKYLDAQQEYFDGEDYHNLLDIINTVKER